MIRKTVYERLFDRLAESPSVRDARPTPDHEGIEMDFVLGDGTWSYVARARPMPDGRFLWTGGVYDSPEAGRAMPSTLDPQTVDVLDADGLCGAIARGLGVAA